MQITNHGQGKEAGLRQLADWRRHCTLPYRLRAVSSTSSAAYPPSNLLRDEPDNVASRWQTASYDSADEFVILELLSRVSNGDESGKDEADAKGDRLDVFPVTITFGKPGKKHACSVKDVWVYAYRDHGDDADCDYGGGGTSDAEGDKDPNLLDGWRWRLVLKATLQPAGQGPLYETFLLLNDNVHNEDDLVGGSHDRRTRFLKIVPKSTWEPKFGYGLWYIELHGVVQQRRSNNNSAPIGPALLDRECMRVVLKYLRQRKLTGEGEVLADRTGVRWQHPLLDTLRELIVERGDFDLALSTLLAHDEEALKNKSAGSIFQEHLDGAPWIARWERLDTPGDLLPDARGGHQLVYDPHGPSLLLHGGWDGRRELGDFWRYDLSNPQWTCLSEDTALNGLGEGRPGPSARSCHKLALHHATRRLYLLGRFVDHLDSSSASNLNSPNGPSNPNSSSSSSSNNGRNRAGNAGPPSTMTTSSMTSNDFFVCDLRTLQWTNLAPSPGLGGDDHAPPPLLFDHQVCIDQRHHKLYVFGGKCSTPHRAGAAATSSESRYGGLYVYDLQTQQWRLLRDDLPHPSSSSSSPPTSGNSALADRRRVVFDSRIGHSMAVDPSTGCLWILMGQRGKDFRGDCVVYDPTTDSVLWQAADVSRDGGPLPGFTQRACLFSSSSSISSFNSISNSANSSNPINSANSNSSANSPSSTIGSSINGASMDDGRAEEDVDMLLVMSGMLRQPSSISSHSTSSGSASGGVKDGAEEALVGMERVSNVLHVLNLATRQWQRVHSLQSSSVEAVPMARFAHQVAHDPRAKAFYMFGGNPGKCNAAAPTTLGDDQQQQRLNDFWRLTVGRRIGHRDLVRHLTLLVKRQRYYELCCLVSTGKGAEGGGGDEALAYLQRELAPLVLNDYHDGQYQNGQCHHGQYQNGHCDIDDEEEEEQEAAIGKTKKQRQRELTKLTQWLFLEPSSSLDADIERSRRRLYRDLVGYLPRDMRPSALSLRDFVSTL